MIFGFQLILTVPSELHDLFLKSYKVRAQLRIDDPVRTFRENLFFAF